MIRNKVILLFLVLLSFKMVAQSPEWTLAGMPMYGRQIRCIYNDTTNNTLYVTGIILVSPTNFSSYFICKYDGSTWTTLGVFNDQVYSLEIYNNELIAAGPFTMINGIPIFSIAKYDGSSWQAMGNFDVDVTKLKVIDSDLYAMGYFDFVNGIPAKRIAKWNGTVWSDVNGFSADLGWYLLDVAIYKGNIYVCGNFENPTLGIDDIAMFKDGIWQNVGGGIHGGWTTLTKMIIYRDELHVLGCILKPDGNVGNGIQKWNDTLWSDVGDGVQGLAGPYEYGHPGTIIRDGVVHNDELYVAGCFGYAGHVPAYSLAKWDGLKWCGLATTGLLSNVALSLNFYNDTLYAGIGDDTLNGIHTNRIIKYIAGSYVDTCSINFTGIDQFSSENEILIYPNPVSLILTIELIGDQNENRVIEVKNVLGQTVKILQLKQGNQKVEVDVAELPKGLYFVQVQTGNRVMSKKFIKE